MLYYPLTYPSNYYIPIYTSVHRTINPPDHSLPTHPSTHPFMGTPHISDVILKVLSTNPNSSLRFVASNRCHFNTSNVWSPQVDYANHGGFDKCKIQPTLLGGVCRCAWADQDAVPCGVKGWRPSSKFRSPSNKDLCELHLCDGWK